jgi:hypothetical protein
MAQRPDPRKQQHWLDVVRRWQRSRLSVREFCRCHRLGEVSFYFWRRTLRERGLWPEVSCGPTETPRFLPVHVGPRNPSTPPLELVLPEGLVVRVATGFDAACLRQLLTLLRTPSC